MGGWAGGVISNQLSPLFGIDRCTGGTIFNVANPNPPMSLGNPIHSKKRQIADRK